MLVISCYLQGLQDKHPRSTHSKQWVTEVFSELQLFSYKCQQFCHTYLPPLLLFSKCFFCNYLLPFEFILKGNQNITVEWEIMSHAIYRKQLLKSINKYQIFKFAPETIPQLLVVCISLIEKLKFGRFNPRSFIFF